ncbi:AT-rich interactive domain-containing protein 2-like [Oscarella lobularis]|uniref:AT-rich interactive domain-containing protein 2-like n=1 Tax=Oscarella lobularis TaxID=121494 RepID=UPI0033135BDE
MANNGASEWENYCADYSHFIDDLEEIRGSALDRLPTFNGSPLNFHRLDEIVRAFGGRAKIDAKSTWDDVAREFGISFPCANASYAIRRYYLQYLSKYERTRAERETTTPEDASIEEASNESAEIEKRPWTRSRTVHATGAAKALLPRGVGASGEPESLSYRRIILSLMSGLPNEADFAVNVCLMLSADEKVPFSLAKTPQLLPILLAHLGIFDEDNCSYRDVYYHGWYQGQSSCCTDYWNHVVKGLSPDDWDPNNRCRVAEVEMEEGPLVEKWSNDSVAFRALQIVTILHNFSVNEDNVPLLSKSASFIRLLLMCIHGHVTSLRHLALDCFVNIADHLVLTPEQSVVYPSLLMYTLQTCILSSEKVMVLKGLETLSQLCTVDENADALEEGMSDEFVDALIAVLLIPDVQLVIAGLESLFQLTNLGRRMCDLVVHAIDVLVSMLTFDVASMGKKALASYKLIEPKQSQSSVARPTPERQKNQVIFVALNQPNTPNSTSGKATPIPIRFLNTTLLKTSQASPQPVPVKTAQPNDMEQAKTWLMENYESVNTGSSSILCSQVYSEYVQSLLHRRGIVQSMSAAGINSLITSVFPQSKVELEGDASQKRYRVEGIKRKVPSSSVKMTPKVVPSRITFEKTTTTTTPVLKAMSSSIPLNLSTIRLNPVSSTVASASTDLTTTQQRRRHDVTSVVMSTTKTPVVSAIINETSSSSSSAKRQKIEETTTPPNLIKRMNGISKRLLEVPPPPRRPVESTLMDLSNSRPVRAAVNRVVGTPLAVKTTLGATMTSHGLIRFVSMPSVAATTTTTTSSGGGVGVGVTLSAESILTRTVRFTTALILRNLARFSSDGKRKLLKYERFIADLSCQASESASALSECLYELGHDS